MAAWLFRILSLAVTGGIIFYAIRAYHHRALARIETAGLELDGYVKIALAAVTFAWLCPDCGAPLLTREALDTHQGSSSACAAYVAEQDRQRAVAEAEALRAEQVSTGREDAWPALGSEDGRAELESAP